MTESPILRSLLASVLILFVLPHIVHGQEGDKPKSREGDAAPLDVSGVVAQLLKLREDRQRQFSDGLTSVMAQLEDAASNGRAAAELYETAVKATEFAGRTKGDKQFDQWQERNEAALKDETVQKALQLHARYIVLCLTQVRGDKASNFVEDALQLTGDYDEHMSQLLEEEAEMRRDWEERKARSEDKRSDREKVSDHEERAANKLALQLMRTDINGSPISKHLALDAHLAKVKDWPKKPQIDAILDKVIFPHLRETNDELILKLWDDRIERAREAAERTDREFDLFKFEQETRPRLLWTRASDEAAIGYPNRARQAKLQILQDYPSHPSFDQWMVELVSDLDPKAGTKLRNEMKTDE